MRSLVIDSSSLISLSSNCMLWLLTKIKKEMGIQLITTPSVRREVVDKALGIDRFRLGGVRNLKLFCNGIIVVKETDHVMSKKLLDTANKVFSIKGRFYKIVHKAEMSLIPLAQTNGDGFIIIDERIVDKLINDALGLKKVFERRLHMDVVVNKKYLDQFKSLIKDVNIIKSSDLLAIAYERGLLKDYVKDCYSKKTMKDFVSGVLWGLKDNGCSISTNDIKEYIRILF